MAKLTPRLPNETDEQPTDNALIVGDIQADLLGFQALLKVAGWNPDNQKIWTVGDDWDRGPHAKEMSEFMLHYGIKRVQSNHNWKHARYAQHELNRQITGKSNPIKPNPEMQDTIYQLGSDYLKHAIPMKDDPLYIFFEDAQGKGLILHGGPNPTQSLAKQDPNLILVRRQHPHPPTFQREMTAEYPAWQDSYNGYLGEEGPLTILHGHNGTPTANHWQNPYVISLDGSGSMGKHRLHEHANGIGWHGVHRLIRLGDRTIFEAPGSKESEDYYQWLIDSGAYTDMAE